MTTSVYPMARGSRPASCNWDLQKPTLRINSHSACVKGLKLVVSFLMAFLFCSSTLYAVTKTSTGTGNWNTAGTWSPSGVPADNDNVIIASGHTVTINTNTNDLTSLTINGTLTIGNNNTNRTVTVTGNITINSSGIFNTIGNGGNKLNIGGNLVNNGIFDMVAGSIDADVTFNGSTNQTLSGTGTTTDFNVITINNTGATNNNIIEISSSKFTAVAGFLTLTKGILKMSGSYTFSNTFFNTATPTINSDEGIWLNNANVTVTAQNGNTVLSGLLRITAGTYNIGTTANKRLSYNTGAILTIEGGALNVAGAFAGSSASQRITYTQSNGIFTVCTVGNTASFGSFEMEATGSVFTTSGGSIVLQNAATSYSDYVNYSTNSTITGGTLQIGNSSTPTGAVFWIESTPSLYNLVISATNNPTGELRVATDILNDVTVGGVLNVSPNNVDMSVGNSWTNNGTFTQGTATVTFNGSSTQQIGGSNSTTFHNLTFNKSSGGGVTLNKTAYINGAGTFTAGVVTCSGTNILIFNDNATTSGANNGTVPSYVHGAVRKIGNDAFTFPVGKIGAGYRLCGISAPGSTTDAFTAEYIRASAASLGLISAIGLYQVSNCEYWNLDRTTGSATINVTLSWNGLSNCNAAAYVNTLGSLAIAHFNGTTWNSSGRSSTTGNASSGTITLNGVSAFSPFGIGSSSPAANPLSVKFSAIKAYAAGNNNKIEWTNETEDAVRQYEVEKSIDGRFFASISTKTLHNSGTINEYAYTDVVVNNKTTWYRIKAVELSGKIIYSAVVNVRREVSDELIVSLYPNPVTEKQFTIRLESKEKANYYVSIINQFGQKVYTTIWQHSGSIALKTIELPSFLSPGIYFVLVSGNNKKTSTKLIVQ